MAAKKQSTTPKASKTKTAPARKKAATKPKTAAKKAAPKKKKASSKKKTAAKAKKPVAGDSPETKTKETKKAPKKTSAPTISSMDVNLGHVFALRPRVNTSFRPNDFMAAKRALRETPFESIADAARATAEEALGLTRGDSARIELPSRR
jgi:hypothetical protein